jgi:AcrR family transcriptional regulator
MTIFMFSPKLPDSLACDIKINVFTKNDKPTSPSSRPQQRGPGRPRGRTRAGEAARRRLYETAIQMIAARGYEATTLRGIAKRARVSPGLLYRYFPSKRAVVLALYEELSGSYADRASKMAPGTWVQRFLFALEASLSVLGGHRQALAALSSVLLGDSEEGLFAPATEASRRRVEAAFTEAVRGASDAPPIEVAAPLGRILYFAHLAIVLWWLLDKSPRQRATSDLLALLAIALPLVGSAVSFEPARTFVEQADRLLQRGLVAGAQNR